MSLRLSRAFTGRRAAAVAGSLGVSVLLAACGGSGPSTNSSASSEASREQKFVQFAKCLREHGIKVQTPNGAGGLKIRVQGGPGGGLSPQTMEAARTACQKYAPSENANLTPAQRVERQEAVRKFAKCMREHGIKVETQVSGGAIRIGINNSSGQGGPNPESPAFQAAQKACNSYLPIKGGKPGGPGGPTTDKSGGPGSGQNSGFAIGG